jgi:hypothetical protein
MWLRLSVKVNSGSLISKQIDNVYDNSIPEICLNRWAWPLAVNA